VTAQEFNHEVTRELGFTLTHWPDGAPGKISTTDMAINWEPQQPIRAIRPATQEYWRKFRAIATRLYRPPLTRMPPDTWCVEAAD
jgi:hypothetical protein